MKKIFACFLLLTFFCCNMSFAQGNEVTVTIQVNPPYSPYLSTYVDQPNKLLLSIINNSGVEQNLKLWVQITGDNGVSVTTSNFTPAQAIHLDATGAGAMLNIDFATSETRDYFDANHLDLVGITKAQLMQNQALPEGNYTICVHALDYRTPFAVKSVDACASFPLSYIDPPLATQPNCESDVSPANPQFVLFSWTPPATAPGNIQYEFTLKEVPNNLNPNDVIKNNSFPVIYNTTQTANPTLAYSVAFPQLEEGKKYVWRVKAVDPNNSVQFKNAGYSEACWFNYKSNAITNLVDLSNPVINTQNITPPVSPIGIPSGINYIPIVTEGQGTVFIPQFILQPSGLNGQAVYHYPNENGTYPLKYATLRLLVGYGLQDDNGNFINDYGFGSNVPDGLLNGSELAVTNTDENGNFNFSFIQTCPFGKVAEQYNTGSGEFRANGKLVRYAYVVLDNPHAEFYDRNFSGKYYFNMGENLNAGVLNTKVIARNLQVTVKKWQWGLSELENSSETLAGANVYLCRKPIDDWQKLIFPQEDGAPDNQVTEKPAALDGLEIVGKGETDANGNVTFWRMVDVYDWNFMYYVYVNFPKDVDGFTNYKLMSGPVQRSYKCPSGFIGCDTYVQEFHMEANFPRVSGWLEDVTDGKRIPGLVMLKSLYLGANNQNLASDGGYQTNDEKDLKDKMIHNQCGFCITTSTRMNLPGADGRFEFLQQPVHFTTGNVKAIGPIRYMQAYSEGYDDKLSVEVKSPLLIGEQAFVKISMTRGASIQGKIVDGETGKGISAQFYFIDENGHSGYTTNAADAESINATLNLVFGTWGQIYVVGDGAFYNYPAKKLQAAQKLIVKAEGYISDTLSVVVNKKNQDLGTLKLFTLKRRLKVYVFDGKTKKLIDGAVVSLPEVKTTCYNEMQTGGSGPLAIKTKIPYDCPLSEMTKDGATKTFSFINDGGVENNGKVFNVHVEGPTGTEYVAADLKTIIPYNSYPKFLFVSLEPGTCVSGFVYEGGGSNLPVTGAKVKMDITESFSFWGTETPWKTGEADATTDATGKYILHHIPMRNYPVTIRAVKTSSQFIGDSFNIVTEPKGNLSGEMGEFLLTDITIKNLLVPNYINSSPPANTDNCMHHDFHLTVYNGMDISSLMGFPIAVSSISPNGSTSATINGYFENVPGNLQFKPKAGQTLSFTNLKIIPGGLKNDKGIPTSQPESTPVNTNENSLKLSAYGVDGFVEDKKLGIYLDKTDAGKQYGVMKGKVHIVGSEFNQAVVGLTSDAYLMLSTGADKMVIPVFNADKTITNPANAPSGFGIGDVDGNALVFSLPGFAKHVKADLTASKFTSAGELQLAARIETNISELTPANLNIDAGVIKLKKGVSPVINSSQPISFKLSDYWTVTSTDWKLDADGLMMKTGKLNTGVQFDFSKIGITYNQLNTMGTHVDISSIKLAKVHPVNITSSQQTFGQIVFEGSTKIWQIYVGPGATGSCGNITNLPGIGATDKVMLHSINFYSNGQKNLFMQKSDLLLRNVLHYHTNDMTSILVNDESFIINGTFDLNIPDKHTYAAALDYEKGGSTLKDLAFINAAPVVFNQPAALGHAFVKNLKVVDGLFTAQGTSKEDGAFPETKTTLYYTNDSVSVWIDGGQNIPINGSRQFGKAEGGMRIKNNAWTPFWFDGEMQGMAGISDKLVNGKPQRMKFIVEGGVSADGQSISMSDVSTPFGNMTWTYNFPQSQLVGHCDIDMNLGSLGLKGGINSVVDGGGWYFQAMGKVIIPGVGDADLMGVFGDYSSHPAFLSSGLGDVKCLPSAFATQVKGFMFQAGIHKQVVPDISFSIPALLSVDFGVDVGLTTRVWKSFGGVNVYGISLLAAVNAHASGSCDATCSDISAEASVQAGIAGDYHPDNGEYSVTGCASVGFELKVSQCLGALGVCGPCLTVDSGHKDVGLNLTYSKSGGADMSINFGACDSQCK